MLGVEQNIMVTFFFIVKCTFYNLDIYNFFKNHKYFFSHFNKTVVFNFVLKLVEIINKKGE